MIEANFPCRKCKHVARRHYQSIAMPEVICLDCVLAKQQVDNPNCWHDFQPDNLTFVEQEAKKKGLI
jgi:hypothetical protein